MKKYLLVGVTFGVLFGAEIGGMAAPPEVWSEQLGMQQLMKNRFRIEDVNKRQNDSRKIAKFFAVVALQGTPGNFDNCNLKARWNRRQMRVQIFEDGGMVNITSGVRTGTYQFQVEEDPDLTQFDVGTPFLFRVKKGRKSFRRSPIRLNSSRLSTGENGQHRVTIIGN